MVFDDFVCRNRNTGVPWGFAVVQYKNEWDVKKAIKNHKGLLIGGRKISV